MGLTSGKSGTIKSDKKKPPHPYGEDGEHLAAVELEVYCEIMDESEK